MDGRQAVIVAHAMNGATVAARSALTEATPTQPWEQQVAACLKVMCTDPDDSPTASDVATMVNGFGDHRPAPNFAVFRARLGLTIATLAATTDPDAAAQIIQTLIGEVADVGDGYAARDMLTYPSLCTADRARLTCLVNASGLGANTLPKKLCRTLNRSTELAVGALALSIRHTTRTPAAEQGF